MLSAFSRVSAATESSERATAFSRTPCDSRRARLCNSTFECVCNNRIKREQLTSDHLREGGRLNFLRGFRPPCGAASPPPIENPPEGAGFAPNGFGAAADAPPPPNGLAAPNAGDAALAPPNAGVELAPPKGFELGALPLPKGFEEPPPNGFAVVPPKGFVDGALVANGAAKLPAPVPPNNDPAVAPTTGDLLA